MSEQNEFSPVPAIESDDPEAYAGEVLKCLSEMREQNRKLSMEIAQINGEKQKIQNDIRYLTNHLAKINYRLAQKTHFNNELKKTIEETETAYSKLIESSHILYESVKQTQDRITDQSNKVESERYPNIFK